MWHTRMFGGCPRVMWPGLAWGTWTLTRPQLGTSPSSAITNKEATGRLSHWHHCMLELGEDCMVLIGEHWCWDRGEHCHGGAPPPPPPPQTQAAWWLSDWTRESYSLLLVDLFFWGSTLNHAIALSNSAKKPCSANVQPMLSQSPAYAQPMSSLCSANAQPMFNCLRYFDTQPMPS